ncbi:hypothetical protein SapgrDRAFT_2396 [Saprospira grandis DSM 2844]|uniref:Uncharacterized protein n=1 Tax=Saprospira grandis DSM 2844 TaxID=694433 RepID=J0P918_9BACT|nr:hypothetical protein SapgrDRAFT_2396 [Saprospira grandis DSM 2844]
MVHEKALQGIAGPFAFCRAQSARRLRGCSRAAAGGRPKAFEAKRKSLQGRADLRAAKWPDPSEASGQPQKRESFAPYS